MNNSWWSASVPNRVAHAIAERANQGLPKAKTVRLAPDLTKKLTGTDRTLIHGLVVAVVDDQMAGSLWLV